MKKLILLLLFGIFLINLVSAESCQVARPYYGSITCEEGQSWSNSEWIGDNELWQCEVPNCIINGINTNKFSCSGGITTTRGLTVTKSGVKIIDCDYTINDLGSECQGSFPKPFYEGDKISVNFWCWPGGEPSSNPGVEVKYHPIMLKLRIDSGENFQQGTEFCNTNNLWSQYSNKQLPDNNVLKSKNIDTSIISGGSNGLSSIPSDSRITGTLSLRQLNVDEGVWFIYDWVTRPGLIAKDYQGMKVWCNPVDRYLTKFEQVNTNGNNCYLIPTQRLSQTVECCSSDECKMQYSDQAILCTDEFKCGYTKSCYSDYDCGGTSSNCMSESERYYLVSSSCDKSKPDSYGKGKCVSSKKGVECCSGNDGGPNACGSGSFCDYNSGCKEVTYKSSSGQVKTGVQAESGITGAAIGGGSSKLWILFAFLPVLIVAAIVLYVLRKKIFGGRGNVEKSAEGGINCKKCGAANEKGKKFCTSCGEKLSSIKKRKR